MLPHYFLLTKIDNFLNDCTPSQSCQVKQRKICQKIINFSIFVPSNFQNTSFSSFAKVKTGCQRKITSQNGKTSYHFENEKP